MYCNESNLINNNEYHILQYAIEYEEEKEVRDTRRTPPRVEEEPEVPDFEHEEPAQREQEEEPIVEITIDRNPTNFDMVMDIDPIEENNSNTAENVEMLDDSSADDIRERMSQVINHYSRVGFQQSRISTTMSYNMRNVTLTRGSDSYYPRSMSPELVLEDGEVIDMTNDDDDDDVADRYVA